jgi:hypothetical protein
LSGVSDASKIAGEEGEKEKKKKDTLRQKETGEIRA